jgi:hypothetical protein
MKDLLHKPENTPYLQANIILLFSWRYNPLWVYFHSPEMGFSLLVFRGFLITQNDAPQSVGPLWNSDQSVAENST